MARPTPNDSAMAAQDLMEGRALALLRSQATLDVPPPGDRAVLFDLLLDMAATAELARSIAFAEVLEALNPRNRVVELAVELYASCLALRNRDTTLAVSLADAGRK